MKLTNNTAEITVTEIQPHSEWQHPPDQDHSLQNHVVAKRMAGLAAFVLLGGGIGAGIGTQAEHIVGGAQAQGISKMETCRDAIEAVPEDQRGTTTITWPPEGSLSGCNHTDVKRTTAPKTFDDLLTPSEITKTIAEKKVSDEIVREKITPGAMAGLGVMMAIIGGAIGCPIVERGIKDARNQPAVRSAQPAQS